MTEQYRLTRDSFIWGTYPKWVEQSIRYEKIVVNTPKFGESVTGVVTTPNGPRIVHANDTITYDSKTGLLGVRQTERK